MGVYWVSLCILYWKIIYLILFQEVDKDPGQATSPYFYYLPNNSLTPLETMVTINSLKKTLVVYSPNDGEKLF